MLLGARVEQSLLRVKGLQGLGIRVQSSSKPRNTWNPNPSHAVHKVNYTSCAVVKELEVL